jgi:hypothetical protein
MKTIKASLLLPLLTFLFSLALSGCYTQLAFVDDEQYSAVEPSPIIVNPPIIMPIVPEPIIDPPPPVYHPLPPAGSSPTVTEPQSQSRTRDFGYQRPGQIENTQTASLGSDTRTSGLTRGGR